MEGADGWGWRRNGGSRFGSLGLDGDRRWEGEVREGGLGKGGVRGKGEWGAERRKGV